MTSPLPGRILSQAMNDLKSPKSILVKCPNWVGDLVAATGALRCFRRTWPEARIALLLRPSLAALMEGSPRHDELIPDGFREGSRKGRRATVRRIREGRFDLGILMTHGFTPRYAMWRGGVARRVGLAKGRFAPLLHEKVSIAELKAGRSFVAKVELYRALCEKLGCEAPEDQRPELFVPEALKRRAGALLAEGGRGEGRKLVGVAPGAAYGPAKRWPAGRFAEVADRLLARGDCDVVLLTSPAESNLADAVQSRMGRALIRPPEGEMDLCMLKALVERCSLLVGNDSGPRHVAIAFGVPAVTVMGPTDPRVTDSPYEKGAIVRGEAPCAPCCKRVCPTDHVCMMSVRAEEVASKAEDWLDGREA